MEDTRRLILDHAVQLVAERGVRDVSFREVARRSGVSHQAPYHHFKNLQGILYAIADEGFRALTDAMERAARKPDPVDALHEIGMAYVLFALEHVGHFRVMFQQGLVDLHDDRRPVEASLQTYQTLVDVTRRVSEAGHAPDLSPEGLAHLCWSTVQGLSFLLVEGTLQTKTKREEQEEVQLVVQALTDLIRNRRAVSGSDTPGTTSDRPHRDRSSSA